MDDRNGKSEPSAAEEAELSKRLAALGKRLDEQRSERPSDIDREAEPARPGMALAFRLAADFVAGIIVGAALGWGFDRLFGTSPWGLMVFLLLGFAAGILSALRSAGLVKPGPSGPDVGRSGN
jgi:ATP synthase protein I